MWEEFSQFLTHIRSIAMTPAQSNLALNSVLHLPEPKPGDKPIRKEGLQALASDLTSRLASYRQELGPNAYAVFNTLTDIAARPPENHQFHKNRDTIEKRSGRWLKELARQSQATGFDLDAWVPTWAVDESGRQRSGRS
jgi:hypothetical protein